MFWIGVAFSLVLIGYFFLEAAQNRKERLRELKSIQRRLSENDVDVDVDVVQYDSIHCEIVESAVDSIVAYYDKGSKSEKRSILFCLDRYLDPYYQYKLPHEEKIFSWLEGEFYKVEDMKVKKEIYELVYNYSDIELRGYDKNDCGDFVEKRT